MKTDTSKKIIEYIGEKEQSTAKELIEHLGISRQALFKHLPKLLEENKIYKVGKPPKVFYSLKEKETPKKAKVAIDAKSKKIINKNYLIITPAGEKLEGFDGFSYWCEKHKLPIQKTAQEYVKTLEKYSAYRKNGLIDGMKKMKGTFGKVYLDEIFYLDFYSIERFGKTKLGQMLLYAKQSQNKKLIKELVALVKPQIETLVRKYQADGVGFVPPTVKREVQFMNELGKGLHLKVKEVKITKIRTDIAVPQKTLNKLEDRIENAEKTFAVEESGNFDVILLIDDAIGSGATLNEIAKKIKKKGAGKKVIGVSLTGSLKGFDVISEV